MVSNSKIFVVANVMLLMSAVSGASAAEGPSAAPVPPTGGDQSDPDKSLSEKLNENEGVIKPKPSGDEEIKKSPPAPVDQNMPVIAPPGEPGGDPNVQPK